VNLFKQRVADLVQSALANMGAGEDAVGPVLELVEIPPDEKLGDFAVPCFAFARTLRRSPVQIAEEIVAQADRPPWLTHIEAVKGYVNVKLHRGHVAQHVLGDILRAGEAYGSREPNGRTVVIDYSSPNIAKPFSLGHIRSTVIGESLARIFAHQGYRVVRINHLGDWGTQFGRVIGGYVRWADHDRLEKEPIKELFRLYVKFHEEAEKDPALEDEARDWFRRMEEGDREALALWRRFRELSLLELERTYARLGIRFDDYTGESAYNDVSDIIEKLRALGLLKESQGAQVVELGDDIPPCLITKSDGTTLYATRDIAAAIRRQEQYNFDLAFYVVDSRQSLHFKQVFGVLERMGYEWASGMEHIPFGTLQFGDEIMSTRKGNVIFLEDVLNEAVTRVKQIIAERNPSLKNADEVAEAVGVGAVIFNDLVHNRIKDISFQWEDVLNFDGDTGPYVQYTHARACSVLRRADEQGARPMSDGFDRLEWEDSEMRLVRLLGRFGETVDAAAKGREPSTVARYVLDLAQAFNGFYHSNRILGSERQAERLALTDAVRQVLANGLRLLAMEAPPEM